jgi:hypothetical protein
VALIGNRSVLLKSPGRFLSGTVASIERNAFGTAGMLANRFQVFSRAGGGIPGGHLSPSSWSLPRTAGGMSSINSAEASISAQGTAYGGISTTGAASITFTVPDAAGQLISSGSGSATFTLTTNTPLLTAALVGSGSASFSITTNTPTLGALAGLVGSASWSISGTLTPYAIGNMVGSTVDSTVLTSDVIASAVWARVIEAGFSAEQVLRIMAAHAAGAATGLEGANPQFTGLDGTTVRIDGTYSAGTRTIDAINAD